MALGQPKSITKQGLTGTEIAEVMWLAATIVQSGVIDVTAKPADEQPTPEDSSSTPGPLPQDSEDSSSEDSTPSTPPQSDSPTADLVPELANGLKLPDNYRPISVPDAPGITNPLEIARALRILAQKAAVGQAKILDEGATVDSVAETGIWQPVLRPSEELWWDVALVFDKHPSMCLWQRFADDLHRLLCRYGQFRDVRIWFLENQEGNLRFVSRNKTVCHQPSELLTGDRRRLIVILSDCVGASWHNGQMQRIVQLWAKRLPTVVFQVFPARLWSRTALARSITVEFQSTTANAANSTLKPAVLSVWDRSRLGTAQRQVEDLPYLPVVPVEPQALQRWAGMLAGDRRERSLGIVWDAAPASSPSDRPSADPATVDDRLDTFILRASPLARQLATLLTAAPVITLPIVRLIRRTMLPQARTVHVAEVFMSSLLKVSGAETSDFENAEKIAYELVDEAVRERLRSGSYLETQEVLNRVSLYVAQGLGKSVQQFRALLRTPSEGSNPSETRFLQAFATVTANILRGLGGDFGAVADRLMAQSPADLALETGNSLRFEPLDVTLGTLETVPDPDPEVTPLPFETIDYTVAQLVEEEEIEVTPEDSLPSTQFTYTVVKLNPDGSEQERYQDTTTGFIELLEESIRLEMIAIPGGEFLMGAPDTEQDSGDDEHPQHRVTVPPFYLGRTPITQAQWRIVAGWDKVQRDLKPNPSYFKGDSLPVEKVSWDDATEFCARLSQRFQREYHLPSEAQWEYACRAGTTTPFHFGETLNTDVVNYNGNYTYGRGRKGVYREKTTPVGSLKAANAWGLLDMHGNVWEWCQDDWYDNYEGAPEDGSASLNKNNSATKKIRGGSWVNRPGGCRSAFRSRFSRDIRFNNLGFRVACPVPRTLEAQPNLRQKNSSP